MTEHWAVWCFRKVCSLKRASQKSNYCCGVTATNTTFRKQIVVRFWIMVPFAKGWLVWFESVSIPRAPDNRTWSNVCVCAQRKNTEINISQLQYISHIYYTCNTNELCTNYTPECVFSCSLSFVICQIWESLSSVWIRLLTFGFTFHPEWSDHK